MRVDTTLELGAPVELTLASSLVSREYVRVVDPPHHLRYDTGDELPGVVAARDQWLAERGPASCAYRTTDTFTGQYAAKVMAATGDWIKAGFDAVAHALKARAELLSSGRPTSNRSS